MKKMLQITSQNRPRERLLVKNPEPVRQIEWTKGGSEFSKLIVKTSKNSIN